ncbi:suppressor of kinetochore protein mutant, partial [Coemansia sp. RSA 1935]
MIRLESSDGRLFAVDQESAYMSSLLKNIDQDLGTDINPILLHNVTGTILARVIEYCVHHRDDVRLDKDVEDLLQDDNQVEAWDRQFMNVDDSTMLQILYAADYLGVEPLVDLGCMFIACIIRDMP